MAAQEARSQRLSAALSSTTTNDTTDSGEALRPLTILDCLLTSDTTEESKDLDVDTRDCPDSSLSIPVPHTMFAAKLSADQMPLTPPPTPPTESLDFNAPEEEYIHPDESFFYHTLGVAIDIRGFDDLGNLILDFDEAARNGG